MLEMPALRSSFKMRCISSASVHCVQMGISSTIFVRASYTTQDMIGRLQLEWHVNGVRARDGVSGLYGAEDTDSWHEMRLINAFIIRHRIRTKELFESQLAFNTR